MKKKYYKVVDLEVFSNGESRYFSARQFYPNEYKLGQWTEAPENTRFFVFDNLDEAKKFQDGNEVIFECEIFGGIQGRGAFYTDDTEEFWKLFNSFVKKKKKVNFDGIFSKMKPTTMPAVLAKKVKLVKPIV